jgi:hypothetical protein
MGKRHKLFQEAESWFQMVVAVTQAVKGKTPEIA